MVLPHKKRRKMRPNNVITKTREEIHVPEKFLKSKKYESDSDSDETDQEAIAKQLSQKKRKKLNKKQLKAVTKAKIDNDTIVVSSRKDKADKKANKQKKKSKKASKSTNEQQQDNSVEPIQETSEPILQQNESEEESKINKTTTKRKTSKRNQKVEVNSDDNSNQENELKQPSIKRIEHLVNNRISFRKKKDVLNSEDNSATLRSRLNDMFVPEVSGDRFISDSDSESDSDEDYETREYPPWQRTLSWNRHPVDEPWPKQRKFGYSDKLKLEKRIKKICQRENISYEEAQEIFSSNKRGQLRFFQKIGKAFPDVPLYRLTKICKETYHKNRNSAPWSPEEIEHLKELISIHGSKPELLSTMMNRSPKNINDFLFNHKPAVQKFKPWTPEEDLLLASGVAEERRKNPEKISFIPIEKLFEGKRTPKQIYARYYAIGHRIQPDGSIEEDRPATTQEHLEYLKGLLRQVNEGNLVEESQLNFAKDRGYVRRLFYLQERSKILGFERMNIKDILYQLIAKYMSMDDDEDE